MTFGDGTARSAGRRGVTSPRPARRSARGPRRPPRRPRGRPSRRRRRPSAAGDSPPARAQAAWRAAPTATYSPGLGTATGTPNRSGAISCTAPEAAAPPMSSTRSHRAPHGAHGIHCGGEVEQHALDHGPGEVLGRRVRAGQPVQRAGGRRQVGGALAVEVGHQGQAAGPRLAGQRKAVQAGVVGAEHGGAGGEHPRCVERADQRQEPALGIRERLRRCRWGRPTASSCARTPCRWCPARRRRRPGRGRGPARRPCCRRCPAPRQPGCRGPTTSAGAATRGTPGRCRWRAGAGRGGSRGCRRTSSRCRRRRRRRSSTRPAVAPSARIRPVSQSWGSTQVRARAACRARVRHPAQLAHGGGGDGHQAGGVGPGLGAQLGDEVVGRLGGAGVVPQQRRRTTSPCSSSSTMPCCWPPTATAETPSRRPPPLASCQAAHQWRGSTSVPSGCDARPVRTTSPVSASQTTTLQDWVEVSTPATSGRSGMSVTLPAFGPGRAGVPR